MEKLLAQAFKSIFLTNISRGVKSIEGFQVSLLRLEFRSDCKYVFTYGSDHISLLLDS